MTPAQSIAYADCFSGVSGDMFLGALLHCGLPQEVLEKELTKLKISGYKLTVSTPSICGIGSCKIEVKCAPQHELRHLSSIRQILEESDLDEAIISTSLKVFTELAEAEAKVHNTTIENVHFHEVGAVDTIIDIVGTVAGLSYLGVKQLYCSPLPMPRGFVQCAHGKLPLPAPAVCEILKNIPCYGVDLDKELVTPTGAALLKSLASGFGIMPPMLIATTGYGAGNNILPSEQPNLLRLFIGHKVEVAEHQEIEVIETNLDDWSPEGFPHLVNLLFSKGALDVNVTPIHMKKGRPGFQLQVISPPHLSVEMKNVLFTETTTIGVRFRKEYRQTLPRKMVTVDTPWGELTAKEVSTPTGVHIYPEYEECLKITQKHDVPLIMVYDAVRQRIMNK